MIRTLRAFFLSRHLREKILLVGLLAVAVAIWGSELSTRASRFWRAQHATTEELKMQEGLLRQRPAIEAATAQAAAEMDPAKTLDPTLLAVEVRRIANDAGVRFNASNVVPGPNVGQFTINTLRINVVPTDWGPFRTFYSELQKRAPYIAITEIAMTPVRNNPAQVQASLTIASFEIKR